MQQNPSALPMTPAAAEYLSNRWLSGNSLQPGHTAYQPGIAGLGNEISAVLQTYDTPNTTIQSSIFTVQTTFVILVLVCVLSS